MNIKTHFVLCIVDIQTIVVVFIIVLIAIVAAPLAVLATVVVFIVLDVIASTTVHFIFVFSMLLLMF
jgi:hypothetical protein